MGHIYRFRLPHVILEQPVNNIATSVKRKQYTKSKVFSYDFQKKIANKSMDDESRLMFGKPRLKYSEIQCQIVTAQSQNFEEERVLE